MLGGTHRYVFICGLHRSGTSLITRCLIEHPQIGGFRNTGAIEDEGQYLQTVMPLETVYGGAGRFGFDPHAHLTEASPLNTPSNARKLLSEWHQNWDLTKPVLVEKTPSNLLRTRLLARLVEPSYFVIVTRHPVAVSLATSKWTEGNLFSLLSHWRHCYQIAKADSAKLPRVIWTSYEDFVAQPQTEMKRILDFVGLASGGMPQLSLRNENEKYFAQWSQLWGNGDRAIRQPHPEHYRSLVTRFRERIARELTEKSLPASRRKANLGMSHDALDAAALFEKDIKEFGYSFHDLHKHRRAKATDVQA